MNRFSGLVALGCAGMCVSTAAGQVVYSHFQAPPVIGGVVAPGWELGEFVTLAGGAQLVGAVEFEFGTLSSAPNGAGTLNLTFYDDGGGVPGTVLQTFSRLVSLNGAGPVRVSFTNMAVDVPASVWVAVRFVQTSGGTPGVIMNDGAPTVGSVSATRVFRDGGVGAWGSAVVTDWMTMRLTTPSPACYVNCDNSVVVPVLNVNDFVCFLMTYAAGSLNANCDGSTIAPVLNVNDFVCFQTRFAAGCP